MELTAKKVNSFDILDNRPEGTASYLRIIGYKSKIGGKDYYELDTDNSYLHETKENLVAFLRAAADVIEARKS